MSPGFFSFFVITVLIRQLVTLFHRIRKISSEFSNRHKSITELVSSDFSEDAMKQFENVGPTFSNCNPFPSWSSAA